MVTEMSKTYQYRKVMKPLLERKRRARINKCLDDLKDLMVECLQQDGEHVTRLEKADILELTVEHMRKLKQRGALSLQSQSSAHVESFRSGYVHAADQITQVLLQQQQDDKVGAKVLKFLSARLLDMQHQLLRNTVAQPSWLHRSTDATAALYAALPSSSSNSSSSTSAASQQSSSSSSFYDLKFEQAPRFGQLARGSEHVDLIDVTTVENCASSRDTPSVLSIDSACSSESAVWRPW